MRWTRFLLCLFLGFLGVHKFAEKKMKLGILYLFTLGLFGIGWIYDCIMYLIAAISGRDRDTDSSGDAKPGVVILAAALIFLMLAIVGMPGISGFLGVAGVVICFPAISWQNFINSRINGVVKAIAIIALLVATVILSPDADISEDIITGTDEPAAVTDIAEEATLEHTAEPTVEVTAEPTAEPTVEPTAEPTVEPTAEPAAKSETDGQDYVLNTNSKRFHYPSCGSVTQMKDKNKKEYHGTREELIEQGYKPCGNCEP